ncbi:MAG: hypothetical protein KIT48_14885 [Pseudolabrys sp.]|nr:hypothetical protein [Pseudolabrys sp.]
MTKLTRLASASAKFRPLELDELILNHLPAEDREAVRRAFRLRSQFSPYLHAVADAVEWCEWRERSSNDSPTAIIKEAVAKFGVREASLDRGWIRGRYSWEELAELRECRRKFRTSRHVRDSK